EFRLYVRLSRRHHANNGAQDSNIRTQKTDTSDFTHVGSGDMVGKDQPKRRSDLSSPAHLTSIEADTFAILSESSCEGISAVPVPAIQQLLIKRANLNLIGRYHILLLR